MSLRDDIAHYTARPSVSVGEAHFVLKSHGLDLQICGVRQLAGLVPHPHQPELRCYTDADVRAALAKASPDTQVLLDVLVSKIEK